MTIQMRIASISFMIAFTSCTTEPVTPNQSFHSTSDSPIVELTTSQGKITLELDRKHAPKTVENFLTYVEMGFYNGTIFHRVIDGFMIQGGGLNPAMNEKPTLGPIPNEASNGLKNNAYTIAMARTQDPDSATAQFFINLVDNRRLDYTTSSRAGYAVFGKVVNGVDVVKEIAKSPTTDLGTYQNVPKKPIAITAVAILK